MGHECCGGKKKPMIYTPEMEARVEQTNHRWERINAILELAGKDAVHFRNELNDMNRAGKYIIARNNELQGEIFDLKSEIDMLKTKISIMAECKTIDELQKAKWYPHKEQFRPVSE